MMAALPEAMKNTYSVCPVCLERLLARRKMREDGIYLVRTCPRHGTFSSLIWRNRVDFAAWRGERPAVGAEENRNCPSGCGLCPDHLRATCCTLLEITDRCNMDCAFCFADPAARPDPPLEEIRRRIRELTDPGKTLLQLSGGEPTVREDLPEIVACAREAGCKYVQLNSNGLRLAQEEAFVKKLADAGLSFVFLQFDGVTDAVYETLRKRPLLEIKKRAIENCGRFGIGVTLVPVLVPGVNTDQIGEIIRFAAARSPYVRGVHFQPVSYFGRIPRLPRDEDRYTLDELMEAVVSQSGGLVKMENLAPSGCDHPLCGFHGDFIVMPDGSLMALTSRKAEQAFACRDARNPAEQNREFVGRRWGRRDVRPVKEAGAGSDPAGAGAAAAGTGADLAGQTGAGSSAAEYGDMTSMEFFLKRARSHGFTVTAMAFQDAGNLDIERLRQCSLHVYRDGKKIPFCACYLTPMGENADAARGGENG